MAYPTGHDQTVYTLGTTSIRLRVSKTVLKVRDTSGRNWPDVRKNCGLAFAKVLHTHSMRPGNKSRREIKPPGQSRASHSHQSLLPTPSVPWDHCPVQTLHRESLMDLLAVGGGSSH